MSLCIISTLPITGNNRVVVDANGNVEERNHYYPYGALMSSSTTSIQRYKYNGKELNQHSYMQWYDYMARQTMPILGRFSSVDPLCEKYYSMSPYLYCANNPVKYVDLDGKEVRIIDQEAFNAMRLTLSPEDREYVKLLDNGSIDRSLMESHQSESGNYNALLFLIQSDLIFNIGCLVTFEYKDSDGIIKEHSLTCLPNTPDSPYYDESLNDKDVKFVNGLTTGDEGNYGQTLMPGKGESGMNSVNDEIYVYFHPSLQKVAKSETVSHELFGHAYSYAMYRDRKRAAHTFIGNVDSNSELRNLILHSRRETVNYFKQYMIR